jgi:hypothetical protein
MISKIFIAVITLSLVSPSVHSQEKADPTLITKMSCILVDDMSYYDFRGLENEKTDYTYMTTGVFGKDNTAYTDKYMFNFCRPTHR